MEKSLSELWAIEQSLWLDGVSAYGEVMAEQCVMAFGPMGIMRNNEIVESLQAAPRWHEVFMTEKATITQDGVAVLAYRATASQRGVDAYEALCTSTYIRVEGIWRLMQHQQTPL